MKKRRRPFWFWAAIVIVTGGLVYPLSFGPACWLDSRRKHVVKAETVSKPLNVFYSPIINMVQRLDNGFSDIILWYAELGAADGFQAQIAVLGPPTATWLVWFDRDLRPGPWLNLTPTPDQAPRED